jgi:hypothetical protein
MPHTVLSNLVLAENMREVVLNRATERSFFFNSGVIDRIPDLGINGHSPTVYMPYWNDLTGNSQPAHNGVNLTVDAITEGREKAAVLSRAKAFGSQDLARALNADDPIDLIESQLGDYWAREFDRIGVQNVLAAMATTVSGSSMAANVNTINTLSGAAGVIDDSAMIDTAGKLGDADTELAITIMHSDVRRKLQKAGVVTSVKPAEEAATIEVYRDRRVISTDRLAPAAGVYTTLFVGVGAMAYSAGTPEVPQEIFREPTTNGGQSAIITRQLFVMHPKGISFEGTPAGETAIDSELSTAANWQRRWNAKNIRITALKHRIA